jgi:formylglycine-generating enzyme required for sulfatase activity
MKRLFALLLLVACSDKETAETAPLVPSSGASSAPTTSATAAVSSSASAAPPQREPPPDRWGDKTAWDGTLEEQNAHMLDLIVYHHGIDAAARAKLEGIFAKSERVGQGNPDAAKHAASPAACESKLEQQKVSYEDEPHEKICGAKWMAPLYDPTSQKAEDASSCIDKFEFPNIPCTYPVAWVRANEAVDICRAVGKRLCDAHEWEGACFGKLTPPEDNYNFGSSLKGEDGMKAQRFVHNNRIHKERRWAYGPKYKKGVCATASRKSKKCGVGWRKCGTNTFPAGFYPTCVSELGVYDQHGNAAEHMNLPLRPEQMASAPTQEYGHTEMKGSWFVFDIIRAHKDHCRWRAPYWHGTKVMNTNSHRNYHLGFRCCKQLKVL